jgi:hypothetical protein
VTVNVGQQETLHLHPPESRKRSHGPGWHGGRPHRNAAHRQIGETHSFSAAAARLTEDTLAISRSTFTGAQFNRATLGVPQYMNLASSSSSDQ